MNADVEFHIKHGYTWAKLPGSIRQLVGNSQQEYENSVKEYSIKNQLMYKGNLVKHVCKDQKKYYEELLAYSRQHLMLYPYHLSEYMIRGLRVTPFSYYYDMMKDIMASERSYDSLPNFTAADCLRLLGIGRNQYIDLMNSTKSNRVVSKLFQLKRKVDKIALPNMVIESVIIEPWWVVKYGFISEEDVKMCKQEEKALLDSLIAYYEESKQYKLAGSLDYKALHGLYRKGFVYLDVPVYESDRIIVPPLEGFVMNRVLGDYFETLLYKIFVSIDEHTSVRELANVLEIDIQLVQNAISVYCRLGFAKKKHWDMPTEGLHPTWTSVNLDKRKEEGDLLIDWDELDAQDADDSESQGRATPFDSCSIDNLTDATQTQSSVTAVESSTSLISSANSGTSNYSKRIAFLFDSTLTAFLMMGNLSPGLKNHAVTMFEVGKLSDETLDSFISELDKVGGRNADGEAKRYFEHALALRDTVLFLRNNKQLFSSDNSNPHGLDLIRCESLLSLDPQVCRKLLNKNYDILISMAPLSNEIRSISSCTPQHLGPAIPEVSSMWFKLYIYSIAENGPPSLFLPKGSKLKMLPAAFKKYDRVQITTWGHDPSILQTSNILLTLQDCLTHSAVLVQAYSKTPDTGSTEHVSFPIQKDHHMASHPAVKCLVDHIDLNTICGYITLLNSTAVCKRSMSSNSLDCMAPEEHQLEVSGDSLALPDSVNHSDWCLLDCCFGIPLFDSNLNKEVCNKILHNNLLNPNSLNELLASTRKLTLSLLEFIASHQDLPLIGDSVAEGSMLPGAHSSDQTIPLPTRILYFNGKSIERWN